MTADSRPTERAMKAAVEMEMHAAVGTKTVAKGETLDKCFPAYDELLIEAKRAAEVMERHIWPKPDVGPDHPYSVLQALQTAIAKAEGRS